MAVEKEDSKIKERCVICCESEFEKEITEYKRSKHFGCDCEIYFHEKCWEQFKNKGQNKCPFCRENLHVAINVYVPIGEREITKEQIFYIVIYHYFLLIGAMYCVGATKLFVNGLRESEQFIIGVFGTFLWFLIYGVCIVDRCVGDVSRKIINTINFVTLLFFGANNVLLYSVRDLEPFIFGAIMSWIPFCYMFLFLLLVGGLCSWCSSCSN